MSVYEMKFKKGNNKKGKLGPGVITGSGSNFDVKRIAKKPILIVIGILIILGLVLLGYKLLIGEKQAKQGPKICSDEIITEANDYLYPTDRGLLDKLPKVISDIRKIENYEKDINCVYPIVVYAAFSGLSDDTKQDLDNFNKISNKQDVSELYSYKMTPDEIKQAIELLIKREQQGAEDAILF